MLATRELTVAIESFSQWLYHQLFGYTNILQNIFFCVQQKKETHTGLEQLDQKLFLGELSL